MNKQNFKLLIKGALPVIFCYLILVGLVGLLVTLYKLPAVFWGDVIRFSLPILIIWLTASSIISLHRWHHFQISQLDTINPANIGEAKLVKFLQVSQAKNANTIRHLRSTQRQQFDHLELFTHEIKNYLTSLNASAENDPSVASDTVKTNVRQANYYLNLLLNDERLAVVNHDYDFQWVQLSALINEILQQNSALFIHKQLIPQLKGLTTVKVLTDQKWLRFCVEQLLSNAIKYSTPGKPINISWEINSLKITNYGHGIPASDLPRVFDNGFTGHNGHQTTTSTGMGLYLVKKVATQLNFAVKISSANAHETTATLVFHSSNIK